MGNVIVGILFASMAVLAVNGISQCSLQREVNEAQHKSNENFIKTQIMTEPTVGPHMVTQKVQDWINSNIDEINKEVFFSMSKDLNYMTLQVDNKEEYMGMENKLTYYPFCIEGQKDLDKLEEFSTLMFQNDAHKKLIDLTRKKYQYETTKVEVPDKEDIKDFCGYEG